jgi:polysaccharide biosynthesis protein PslG
MPATLVARRRLHALGFVLVLLAAIAISLSARIAPAKAAHAHFVGPAPTLATRHSNVNPFGQRLFGVAAGGALQNEAPATLSHDLADDRAAGSRWIRFDINWAQVQAAGPDSYDWTNIDRVVKGAEARGMSVLGTIVYTPSWARPAGTPADWGPKAAPYARFAAAAAQHLAAENVHALEIWNEPNSMGAWAPRPSAAGYTAILKAADTAIKRVAPHDTVITGGTSPASTTGGNIAPVQFLRGIYAHGGQGSFDAVGAHPYCWPDYPGATDDWSAWYQMYGTKTSMRSVMKSHGDGAKTIWATEFGAPTEGPRGTHVSDATQAKMVQSAYTLFASYRWAGPLFLYQGRDASSSTSSYYDSFGFINHNFTPKPAFHAYQRISAAL